MSLEKWGNWKALTAQLFVTFIGLVGALQVNDWRDQRDRIKTETVYLHRLSDDLKSYIASLKLSIPVVEEHRRAVAHIHESFGAGRILRGDTALFESGLIYVAHLPSVNRPMSAYEEMVASGVFARLRSSELQRAVSELYATQTWVDANFSWWREGPSQLEVALQPFVEYYSEGFDRVASTAFLAGSEGRRIRYDFHQLRSQPVIRNGYYWAEDTHSDWVEWSKKLLDLAVAAEAIVGLELKGR